MGVVCSSLSIELVFNSVLELVFLKILKALSWDPCLVFIVGVVGLCSIVVDSDFLSKLENLFS